MEFLIGCLVRDLEGLVLAVASVPIEGRASIFLAECRALLLGYSLVLSMNHQKVVFETDSVGVSEWFRRALICHAEYLRIAIALEICLGITRPLR